MLSLEAECEESTEYGDNRIVGALIGPNGRTLRVVSVWMIEAVGGKVCALSSRLPDRTWSTRHGASHYTQPTEEGMKKRTEAPLQNDALTVVRALVQIWQRLKSRTNARLAGRSEQIPGGLDAGEV
ncbi:MAG: hypothetical protein ACHQ9S_05295 [Candidatus Binatia bacterium]